MAGLAKSLRYNIDNTGFVYKPNFEGRSNPNSKYPTHTRSCQIQITSPQQLDEMQKLGFRIKETRPGKNATQEQIDNFIPKAYIDCTINYWNTRTNTRLEFPPRVYLITGNSMPVELGEDEIHLIDTIRVKNINVIINGTMTADREGNEYRKAYINTIYVEQEIESDPYLEMYKRRAMELDAEAVDPDSDLEVPFN